MELKEARFKRRVSQWDIQLHTGVYQTRISLIEHGHAATEFEKKQITRYLKIKSEDIDWPSEGAIRRT